MLCIKTEVKDSSIPNAGKGLFSLEYAPKGSIIFIPMTVSTVDKVVLEEQFQKVLSQANKISFNSGIRWGGHYFWYSPQVTDDTDYINHANNPNLLSCLGFFFALRDIHFGDELTLNYRYIELEGDVELITSDREKIIGLSAKEALLQSAQELIKLLNEVEDIHCFDLPNQPD